MCIFDALTALPKREYIAPAAASQQGSTQLVPVYNIFCSDELTARSEVVASQLLPAAFSVSTDDAHKWQLQSGDMLTVTVKGVCTTLPVQLVDYLAESCVAILWVRGCIRSPASAAYTDISIVKSATTNTVVPPAANNGGVTAQVTPGGGIMDYSVRQMPDLPAWLAGVMSPEAWSIVFWQCNQLLFSWRW